jgi:hypothetical protein
MSGHTNWRAFAGRVLRLEGRFGTPVTAPQMLAYVQGYILALEDILNDIENLEYVNGPDNVSVIENRIKRALLEARKPWSD